MPVVPKHALHYHRHLHARNPVPIPAVTEERDLSQSLGNLPLDGSVQLHGTLGLSAFIFLCVVILGYLFRRHIRSVPSRLASSVHATPVLNLIHIHSHTARHFYFPLQQDADTYETPSSPVTDSPITSPVREHGPAPPYSRKGEERSKNLQITVPPRQSTLTRQVSHHGERVDARSPSGSSIASTPSFLSDAGSSCGGPSPLSTPVSVLSATLPEQKHYRSQHDEAKLIESKSKTGVLSLASPRASRWDAFSGYLSNSNHHAKDESNPLHNFNGARRVTDIMITDSPCATPPPQYTITIHSGQRSRASDSESGAVVPDIILSPVPWMPKEFHPPPSPPCYLAVPARKRKSRHHFTEPATKPLPYVPRQKPTSSLDTEVKSRHAFRTETVNEKATPLVSLARSISNPSTKSSVPLVRPHHVPRRSATLPLPQTRGAPTPKPVLPLELEAVYPSSDTSDNEVSEKEEGAWLWRSRSPSPSPPAPIRQPLAGGRMPFVSEKTTFSSNEEKEKDKDDSDDDVPLAKGLMVAMKRKRDAFAARAKGENRVEVQALGEKATVFKKQFFGRLSALAAKAKSTIEQQFDSSDDETEEEEEELAPIARGRSDAQFYFEEKQREAEKRARETFVIGDDDFEE